MPVWLPGVLTALILGLAGNYLSVMIMVRLNTAMTAELARRILALEENKLDRDVHQAEKEHVMGRIEVNERAVQSAGHRINGIDQRITAVDDRIRGAA